MADTYEEATNLHIQFLKMRGKWSEAFELTCKMKLFTFKILNP